MFYTNYKTKKYHGEVFPLPSCTVPDESMTIPEIIARFVRSGSMPVSVHSDIGDNEAFEPGFDPLDFQPKEVVDSLRPQKPANKESASEGGSISSEGGKPQNEPKNGE